MKKLIKLSILALVFISFAFISKSDKITIVIDAGHGGSDFGATINGLSEKEIVSSVAQKIRNLNPNSNIEILLTRTEDQMMSLQERVDFVNGIKPDLVISLHANASEDKESNGLECFVSDKSVEYTTSNELAQKFTNSISNKTQLNIRGVKKAPFFILKKSEVPAILIELGFMTNKKDKSYLESEESQIKIAQNILDFVSTIKS